MGPRTDVGPPHAPFSLPVRMMIAAVAAILAATRAMSWAKETPRPSDFGQVWFAARAVLQRANPYELIGPGLEFDWPGHFYYPLPAAILGVPFAPFPLVVAEALFAGLSAGVLAWAFSRFGYTGLLMLVSPSAIIALQLVQWSPLLTAAILLPWVGIVLAAKPTIGVAIFGARPSTWAVAGGAVLVGISFIVQPSWPQAWLIALQSTDIVGGAGFPYRAPLFHPGGFLLVLSFLRWRRVEARLVGLLALVPQTPILYETLPILLVARSRAQVAYFFAAGCAVLLFVQMGQPYPDFPSEVGAGAPFIFWLMYLPALLLVLSRPNEGNAHPLLLRSLERAGVPTWLRGKNCEPSPT